MRDLPPTVLHKLSTDYSYNPETGILTRLSTKRSPTRKSHGYIQVTICDGNKRYYITAHRLCWFLYYGTWPEYLDHKNLDKTDNRISNLRECTIQENNLNRTKQKRAIYKGVYFHKASGKYHAQIMHNGKRLNLGLFLSAEEAAKAYDAKALELFGAFARLNFSTNLSLSEPNNVAAQ